MESIVWSTREKLAILSFAKRVGENEWIDAEKFLEPFCEVGRPANWLAATSCAHYFKQLLKDDPAGKESHGSTSAHDDAINSLALLRIQELEDLISKESSHYKELTAELQSIESGLADDKLDELLEQNGCATTKAIKVEPDKSSTVQADQAVNENQHTLAAPPVTTTPCIQDQVTESICLKSSSSTTLREKSAICPDRHVKDPVTTATTNIDFALCDSEQEVQEFSSSKENAGEPPPEPDIFGEVCLDDKAYSPDQCVDQCDFTGADDSVFKSCDEIGNPSGEDINLVTVDEDLSKAESSSKLGVAASVDKQLSASVMCSQSDEIPKHTNVEHVTVLHEDAVEAAITYVSSPLITAECNTRPITTSSRHIKAETEVETASFKAWRKSIIILWKQIASHRYSSLFMQPVTDDIAPNYSSTVYRAIDLTSIKRDIETGIMRSTGEFQRDLMLMFQNAIMYNSSDHDVHRMALEMRSEVMSQVAQFHTTQIQLEMATVDAAAAKVTPSVGVIRASNNALLTVLVREARSKRISSHRRYDQSNEKETAANTTRT